VSDAAAPVLVVSELSLRFGGLSVLNDVSFDVNDAELFAIIGPNGAGKSSIFNCINGVYRPQVGSIRLDGVSLLGKRPSTIAAMGIGRTFQNLGLFSTLDIVENLMLGRHHRMRAGFVSSMIWRGKARRDEIVNREAVERVIALLELEQYRQRPVGLLPYGVQKRIELGRALAMEPRLLLLDEPVAGMNAAETEAMARYIIEAQRDMGVAMILVEHDMHLVMDVADRVLALDFGVPIATGTPELVAGDQGVIDAYLGKAS